MHIPAATKPDGHPTPAPHVQYFAEGSDALVIAEFELLANLRECKQRFPEICSEEETRRKGGPTLSGIEELLDLGSLYADALARVPVQKFDSVDQMAVASRQQEQRLEKEVDAYDRELVIRAVALHMACGENPESVPMLYFMYRLDLQRFHQPPANEEQFLAAVQPMDHEAQLKAKLIKSQWMDSTCQRAKELGRQLIPSYYNKVRALNDDGWKPLSKSEHRRLLGEHAITVVLSLACAHEPAVCKRIDDYNQKAAPRRAKD